MLAEIPDWDSFVRLINAHGIIALAAFNIKEAGLAGMVPVQSMVMLENGLRQSIVRNAWLTERWKEMNAILSDAGIQHLLLKGMALEHTVYGAKGLRQMTDNDILVRKEEAKVAWDLLKRHRFLPQESKSHLHSEIIFRKGRHLPALIKDGYSVEIHTEVITDLNGNMIFPEHIFRDTLEFEIDGSKAFCPDVQAHLRFLRDHYRRHTEAGESQVRSFADIMLLDPGSGDSFPDSFVTNPDQKGKWKYRRLHYKSTVRTVERGYRIRFVIGDIFPSLSWMRKRYRCGTVAAVGRYPQRLGKLLWLL
jgi:hypothetical protein